MALLLAGAIVAIILFVVKVEWFDRIRGRKASAGPSGSREERAQTQIGLAYQQSARAVGKLGLPRLPSETPDEYAERARPFLRDFGARLGIDLQPATFEEVTRRFVLAKYAGVVGEPVVPDEFLRAARRAWWVSRFSFGRRARTAL